MTSLLTPAVLKLRRSQPIREAMATLLADPTMQQALAALDESTRPSSIPASIPGNHPDTAIAHEFYRMYGIAQAVSTLRAFAHAEGTLDGDKPVAGTEFMHSLPPELRKKPV